MRNLLGYTWVWLRHQTHDFDFTQEPLGQKDARHYVVTQIHKLEYDPQTQWKYHLRMSWFWLINFPIATAWLTFAPGAWASLGVYYVAVLSIYANFASDYTGVHAAWAALRGDQIVMEVDHLDEQIDDLDEHIENETEQP